MTNKVFTNKLVSLADFLFIVGLFVAAGLFVVNVLTPEHCRDGMFDIKDTPECSVYRLG